MKQTFSIIFEIQKKHLNKPKIVSGLASCGEDISLHIKGNIEITKLVENFVCDDPAVGGLEGWFCFFPTFLFM